MREREETITKYFTPNTKTKPASSEAILVFYQPSLRKKYPNLRLRMSGNLTEHLLGIGVGPLSEILSVNDT